LTGLERTPELYRCGICYAGVTDVVRTLVDAPDVEIIRARIAETVGDPKREEERLKARSPLTHADQIQVPVFLAYGKLDRKVPLSTGRDMAKALEKRGKLFEFMVKDDEGHTFLKERNRIEFWKKVDEFLKAKMQ
jgi:dipeptidyl aminopeptidase/acylaminoacyl peptidase